MLLNQMTVLQSNSTARSMVDTVAALSIALLIDVLILILPPPVLVTRVLFNFHLGLNLLLIILFALVFRGKGFVWNSASITLTLALFSIPLIYKWQTAGFYGYLIGGLLPWSDASAYYSAAHQLVYEGHLSVWGTRRPLFGGFLAVLLWVTGGNLQLTLAILAVLNGLAVFFAAREIQEKHGSLIATIFLAICYWYYCAHAGITASEQLGVCFGSLGIAFLIRGSGSESIKSAAFGLFLLTIALNARAGAFFILPTITLWFAFHFKEWLGWWKPVAVGVAVIIIGMLANLAMVKTVGSLNGVPFSNYSYTLYGLASGNKGWSQVTEDYPGVKEEDVFGLAIQKIREKPSLFLIGIFGSYQDYFTATYGAFSFLDLVNGRKGIGNQLLWTLTWLGLAFALFKRKKGQSGLVLAAFLGILLSAGLVPPRDANSMRIYAATIPCTAYIASTGMAFLSQLLKKLGLSARASAEWQSNPDLLLPFSAALLVLCFAGPLLVKIASNPPKSDLSLSCPLGKDEVTFLKSKGSSLNLVDDQSIKESYLPDIRLTDFRTGTEAGPYFYPSLIEELLSLDSGYAISIGMYRKPGATNDDDLMQRGYLLTHETILKPGPHQLCITGIQGEYLQDNFFYYEPETVEAIQHQPSIAHRNPTLVKETRKLYGLGVLLIYVFASLNYLEFWAASQFKKLLIVGCVTVIFAGALIYLHSNALFPLAWERKSLSMKNAIHESGHSYKLPLGIDWMDRKNLGESPAIIYEDDTPLKFPNTPAFIVNRRGRGRFTIEGGNLILSSSDNSDPRTNGRRYEIYWPIPILSSIRWVFHALAIISALLLFFHLRETNSQIEGPDSV
jgi:hypothetical protein